MGEPSTTVSCNEFPGVFFVKADVVRRRISGLEKLVFLVIRSDCFVVLNAAIAQLLTGR